MAYSNDKICNATDDSFASDGSNFQVTLLIDKQINK